MSQIKDTIDYLKTKRMLMVVPLMLWNGLSLAIYQGSFVVIINRALDLDPTLDPSSKLSIAMYAFVPFGFAQVFGGLVVGKIIDKWRQRAGILVTIAFTILAYIFIMLFLYQQKNNLTLYLATFTYGFQDSQ